MNLFRYVSDLMPHRTVCRLLAIVCAAIASVVSVAEVAYGQTQSQSGLQSSNQTTATQSPGITNRQTEDDSTKNGSPLESIKRSSSLFPELSSDTSDTLDFFTDGPERWTSPRGLTSSLQILLMLTVLSLAPAVLLMTTCYVRIIVVMGLLRQALGTGQLPPSQVITALALFMTIFVMTPVWNEVYEEGIKPYTTEGSNMSLNEAWKKGSAPIHRFMSRQIDMAGSHEDVELFYSYYDPDGELPEYFEDVPMRVLVPAYMLSELKTAFAMGFQIYLPFLILDIVVASVTISMGMMMLPPAMISLPFKLMLFVLVDGWRMVVSMLLESFGTLT